MHYYCKQCDQPLRNGTKMCQMCGNIFPMEVPIDNREVGAGTWPPDNPQGLRKNAATIGKAWNGLSYGLQAGILGCILVALIAGVGISSRKELTTEKPMSASASTAASKVVVPVSSPVSSQIPPANDQMPTVDPTPQPAQQWTPHTAISTSSYPAPRNVPDIVQPATQNSNSTPDNTIANANISQFQSNLQQATQSAQSELSAEQSASSYTDMKIHQANAMEYAKQCNDMASEAPAGYQQQAKSAGDQIQMQAMQNASNYKPSDSDYDAAISH